MSASPRTCASCGSDLAAQGGTAPGDDLCPKCARPHEPGAGYALVDEPAAPPPAPRAVCAGCGILMPPGVSLCARCGHFAGSTAAKGPGIAGRCAQCGYDLRGLREPRCPECGTVFAAGRAQWRRAYSQNEARRAWVRPLVMLPAGLAVSLIGGAITGGGLGFLFRIIRYAVELPITTAVFWACALLWVGSDAPAGLTLLRLAAVVAAADAAGVVLGWLPWVISLFISLGVFVAVLAHEMELDLIDAVFVGMFAGLAKWLAVLALVWYFFPSLS